MALYHRATLTPSKAEVVTGWAPTQPWCFAEASELDVFGAYRFDDPSGRVGMETHLAQADGVVYQVPLTYRDEPLAGAEAALICEMDHSALGTRWVYDGLADPLMLTMMAAVAMTGQGEALGLVEVDGRWIIAPTNVRLEGGGWGQERVAVNGFDPAPAGDPAADAATFANDRFELTVWRRPAVGDRPRMGLSGTWDDEPSRLLARVVSQ